jgi:hypothetical protein
MSSEDIGANEDLGLTEEDADNVVGGKKKKVTRKATTKKSPAHHIIVAGPTTPAAPQSQAEFEAAYDRDMVEHGLDPVYGTGSKDADATE